ncbi:MAG: leucine-rich repeat protein [Muribaculaceae bacterium]|nr:leucine-rich repeat protein [Muribaculaceae bacterium]
MKMRIPLLLLAMASVAVQAAALDVTTTAGALSQAVTDVSATTLTVTGTLDARDFRFLTSSMPQLATLDLSHATIVAWDDPEGSLLSSMTHYAADALPSGALLGSTLSQVTLPATLTAIGQGAFAGCQQLTAITLPESVATIGSYAFSHSGLISVEIPATVTVLGEGAFARCGQLTSAVIHSPAVSNSAFKNDTLLSQVTIGGEVTAIGNEAFAGCTRLETLTLSEPCAVATIDREAFTGSGLASIGLEAMPQLTSIGAWAFARTPLQEVAVPATVQTLGEGAFYYADVLTQAALPTLAELPDFTFAGAASATLGDLLGEGVERIGAYAFYGDTACATLTLPSTVGYIGTRAMAGMTGLTRLNVLGDVAMLGDSVWAGVDQPHVKLDTQRGNEVSDLFAEAEQWREFHILRDYLLGDVNNDTRINVRDITTTVDYILEHEPPVFIFAAANVMDDDEAINVRDVTGLADLILDEEERTVRAIRGRHTPPAMPDTDDELVMHDLTVGSQWTATIEVELNNLQAYNALQFDAHLPIGMELVNCEVTGRMIQHTAAMRSRDNGYRIVAYSADNAPIAAGEGAVIDLTVSINSRPMSGDYILLDNITFADQVSDYAASPSVAFIDIVTGVDDLTAGASRAWGESGQIVVESSTGGRVRVVAVNGMSREVTVEAGRTSLAAEPGVYVVVAGGASHKVVVK